MIGSRIDTFELEVLKSGQLSRAAGASVNPG
jgi:hypothetical protein